MRLDGCYLIRSCRISEIRTCTDLTRFRRSTERRHVHGERLWATIRFQIRRDPRTRLEALLECAQLFKAIDRLLRKRPHVVECMPRDEIAERQLIPHPKTIAVVVLLQDALHFAQNLLQSRRLKFVALLCEIGTPIKSSDHTLRLDHSLLDDVAPNTLAFIAPLQIKFAREIPIDRVTLKNIQIVLFV